MLKLMGSVKPLGMTRIGRWLLLEDRALWRQHLQQLAEIENHRLLCMAHGAFVEGDVRAALLEAARREQG